ncbi:MAG: small subunit ribosomal protein [Thermotogaceae bacterium]|nr:small subunit ribosomal protein [Thermotogaceae bacterium]MDN5338225.1 small subunit ribosomal protein [Thermotogaceae bacterium]
MERSDINSMEQILDQIEFSRTPEVGEVVKAKVIQVGDTEVIVDIGGKFEGFINSQHLLKPIKEYKIGEEIFARVSKVSEDLGRVLLTEKGYYLSKTLREIEKAFNSDQPIVEGEIVDEIKGGYRVLVKDVIEAFLPGSHADFRRNDHPKGKRYKFMIIDFKRGRRGYNVVLSRKAILEKELEDFFDKISEGTVIEGIVENVRNFGAFVNLGPVTGIIPASEISWDPELRPFDVCKKGQKVKVFVLEIDRPKKKVTLSLKRLTIDPWENVSEKYSVGDIVSGTVKKIFPFGFTVKLEPGIEGMVHISEVFWGSKKRDIREVVSENQTVKVEILSINPEERKISLSFKNAQGNPWEKIEERYKAGDIIEGTVTRILPTGVIVEIEDGVTGFIHISELSWSFVDSVDSIVKNGDRIRVKILSIEPEKKKISLSLKKAQPDPWEKVVEEIKEGSTIKGKVIKISETGAIVNIEKYGVDAFLPASQISVERINKIDEVLKNGDEVEAKVIRLVYKPEEDKRDMVISIRQLILGKEKEEYKKYIQEHSGESLTLGEILNEKEGDIQ